MTKTQVSRYPASQWAVWTTLIVASLGYFVDVYDLLIFSIVRVASLKSLGVADPELLPTGLFLLNAQMIGMLIGGVMWGVWGDKRGRISVLLGSIFLYSTANIINGFVTTIPLYGFLRFLAGVGLAGELGAGITLVSELMPKETRGYGTTLVATIGVLGAVVAALVGDHLSWQAAYWVGGGLGLALLLLRVGVHESGMFHAVKSKNVKRGDLLHLFRTRERFFRYLSCICIGLPIWYVIGILVTFSPEFGRAFSISEPVSAGRAVMWSYIGLVLGDLACGILSQLLRNRRKVIFAFITLTAISVLYYLLYARGVSVQAFYWICVPLGFAVGYWSVFVTTAAEQFGTNLRATVTTTVPNFVRGAVVPITAAFQFLKGGYGITQSALIVGGVCLLLAYAALFTMHETFGKDLDFTEGP